MSRYSSRTVRSWVCPGSRNKSLECTQSVSITSDKTFSSWINSNRKLIPTRTYDCEKKPPNHGVSQGDYLVILKANQPAALPAGMDSTTLESARSSASFEDTPRPYRQRESDYHVLDSSNSCSAPEQHPETVLEAAYRSSSALSHWLSAVSYTHLTLPTIYSV